MRSIARTLALLTILALVAALSPASALDQRVGRGLITNGVYRPCSATNDSPALIFDFIGRMPFGDSSYQVVGEWGGFPGWCTGEMLTLWPVVIEATSPGGQRRYTENLVCELNVSLQRGTLAALNKQRTLLFSGTCYGDFRSTPPEYRWPQFTFSVRVQPASRSGGRYYGLQGERTRRPSPSERGVPGSSRHAPPIAAPTRRGS